MAPRIDLSGQEFNGVKIIKWIPQPGRNGTFYLCLCPYCGKEFINRGSDIKRGQVKSCGCWRKQNKYQKIPGYIDLVGLRFGKVQVINETEKRSQDGSIIWECLCDCGEICYRNTKTLKNPNSEHCCDLCYQDMWDSKAHTKSDLIGQRFGYCTVIEETNKRQKGFIVWKCQCDCGNIFEANTNKLNQGIKFSCGCTKRVSKGEEKIKELLQNNHIKFEQQYKFADCKFIDTNRCAYFDFFVNNKYIIEYDGIQHFEYRENGIYDKNKYLKTVEHDMFKNFYCKLHNIPIIRIPYTHFKDICIEDLLLESSKYII